MDYGQLISDTMLARRAPAPRKTQARPVDGQVRNNNGGFSFQVDDWTRATRFLILGADGGTLYAGPRKIAVESAACIRNCIKQNPRRMADLIESVSVTGRAPKNDPAILALALLLGAGTPAREMGFGLVRKVCRTGTDILHLASYVDSLNHWSKFQRDSIAQWYTDADPSNVAFQTTKFANRDGWTHRDVLRLCHANPPTQYHSAIFRYIACGDESLLVPEGRSEWSAIELKKRLHAAADLGSIVAICRENKVPWEFLPSDVLNNAAVWDALLPNMKATALVRNLGKMTSVGLLTRLSYASKVVTEKLDNEDWVRSEKLHPMKSLLAWDVYRKGAGIKGSLTWTPVPRITQALENAFYSGFATLPATGKRFLAGIDVSGSMDSSKIAGSHLTAREGVAALVLQLWGSEPDVGMHAFSDQFYRLKLSPDTRLADFIAAVNTLTFSATDCSLPMAYAHNEGIAVDTFVVYTDSETNCNRVAPHRALQMYRDKMGIDSKLVVVAVSASNVTIADPHDAGMLDVVGMDADTPAIISDFARTGY